MKKIVIFMIALLATTGVFAQSSTYQRKTSKKPSNASNIYVGGGLTFESTSDETAIAIIPEVGYKFSDKWSAGVRLGYGSQGSGDSKYSIFSFKPYLRQNLLAIDQIALVLDYQLVYQNDGYKDNKTNTFGLGVSPALAWNINSKLSFVTHVGFLGYTSSKLDVEGAEAVNTFRLNASSENITFSIYYNL